ncbi:MAG: rhomboid family intramembrane serine protease [Opitutaceae bacterium]|nr:rhomboid family intramembrane serine protease [Opitutaceae bacterium]
MSLLTKLERYLGRLALPNLSLWLVAGQVMFWGLALLGNFDLSRATLLPLAVREGEWWRLFTFLFVPPAVHPVFIAFAWYLFYLMGSALEHFWGTFRYNVFLGLGWVLTLAVAFVTPTAYATNLFLAGSVFLAFAFLNPDFELLIFFILPLKIKWLALIQWAGYAFVLAVGSWPARLMVLASIGNFLVFFAGDIVQLMRGGGRSMGQRARKFGTQKAEREPRHRCHVCGKTDITHPQLDFRYCSKCAGDECYCPEHIFSHEHVTAETPARK